MSVEKIPARNAFSWLQSAWRYFKVDPILWAGMALTLMLVMALLSFIPVLGPIASTFLFPLSYAGFLYGLSELEGGRELKLNHLWQAIMEPRIRTNIVLLTILPLGYTIVANILTLALGINPVTIMTLAISSIAVSLALMFAVPLVLFQNAEPLIAIKTSFNAGVANMAPLGVLLLINIVVGGLLGVITVGLASIVLLPITIATLYSAYRDIFASKV